MRVYKPSKFNYFTQNLQGDIIVYNYLYKQLCKFSSAKFSNIQNYLKESSMYESTDNTFMVLKERKLIVPIDTNEDIESKIDFMKEIARPILGLTIYPTMGCNFRCPYCYQSHDNLIMSESVSNSIIKFVRKNISHYTGMVVAWFGGEPLERADLLVEMSQKLKNLCHNRNRTYYSSITSNGYNLELNLFKILVLECNIRRFAITIDGLSNIHDKQRYTKNNEGSFNKIISNLLQIKSISKSIDFEIIVRSNISIEGYNDLKNYVKFMNEKFSDDPRFCFYFRPVYNWGGNSIDEFKENLIEGYSNQKKIYERLLEINIPLNLRQHYLDLMESSICYANRINSFAIETDGKVAKCTGESRSGINYVGKLSSDGTLTICSNKNALWASQYDTVNTNCRNCFFEANCHSNFCLIEKLYDNSKKCHCPSGKDFIKEFILLLDSFNDKFPYIEVVDGGPER